MMRLIFILISMFLLAVPVQAEDKIDPASAPEASGAPAAATTGSQPTDNLPTLVIPEPPAPVVSNSDKLLIQRKLLAPKKIELLRATVKATTVEKGFFSSLFSSSVNPVDIELLAEMDRFINQSPELAESAEVYQLKAQVHKRIQNFPAVALDWAMLLAAYPDSSFTAEAQKGLKELSDGKLKKQAATIAAMTEKLGSLSGERDQREATFLIFLGTLRDADFAVPIAAECAAFLARNQTYTDDDRIVHAQAHQQMQINNDVAIYHFNKLLALYPASTLRPDSYLSLGTIQRKGLKHYDLAAVNFKAVIEKHSESEEAKQAYELLANMYDEDMSDYPNAIKIYEAIVTRYKNDPVVLRALQAQARIYQNKTSQPMQAIATYKKLAEIFKGKEGLDALLKAEQLAQGTVRDWKLSIEINDNIISAYPDSDDAAKAQYAKAEIYEDNLKDREQAIKSYQELIDHYPKNSLAADAKRHIGSLEQKK